MVEAQLLKLREVIAAPRSPRRETEEANVEARRTTLARKRARLLDLYSDGTIERSELDAGLAKLDVERTRLDALVQSARGPSPAALRATLAQVGQMAAAWRGAKPIARRSIVGALARAVRLAAGEAPAFDWIEPDELVRRGQE
jgi:hypothetical protein